MNIERSFNNPLVSLIRPPMFWRPAFQSGSDWLDYVPFGFWVIDASRPQRVVEVGTTSGNSYFSFCQAISSLQLTTQAVCIRDTEAVDQKVAQDPVHTHNSSSYGGFSSIFSGMVSHAHVFDDALVDLLHINRCVPSMLETIVESWKSKLSDRAVMIIRLRQEFNESAQALDFLKNLKSMYSFFELTHGDGALVFQIGSKASPIMEKLYQCGRSPAYKKVVKEVFSSLGLGCLDGYYARAASTSYTLPSSNMDANKSKLDIDADRTAIPVSPGTERSIATVELELSEAKDHLDQLRDALLYRDKQIVTAKGMQQKSEQEVTRLQAAMQERFAEVAKLTQIAEDLNKKILVVESEASAATAKLKTQKTSETKKLAALEAQIASLDASLKSASKTLADDAAKLKTQKANEAKKVAALEAQIASLDASLKFANKKLADDAAKLKTQKASESKKVAALEAKVASLGESLAASNGIAAEASSRESDLKQQLDELKATAILHNKALLKRDGRIAELEREIIKSAVAFDAAKKNSNDLAVRVDSLNSELTREKLRADEAEKGSAEGKLAQHKKLDERQRALDKVRKDLALAEQRALELQTEVQNLTNIVFSKSDASLDPQVNDSQRKKKQASSSSGVAIPLVGYVRKKFAPKRQTGVTESDQIEVIRKSGRFDMKWYVSQYPDVRDARVDPVVHYVRHGAIEGRNPAPSFNTNNYLATHPDIDVSSLNPLYHFIESNR